jgi:2-amino-4-hydroxy-6-hydroxymethyldihydropteridine diphosphokinase
MTVAYLGLGANLGDRRAAITWALDALDAADVVRITARSPLYETDAVAPDPQPPYLNAAARVETALTARALLAACLEVERALGRVRPPGQPAAARTIDVDLLLYGDAVIDQPPHLVVPHPRLLERAFVRIPLADVALPGLVHPVTREPLDRAPPAPSVRRLPGD